MSGLPQQLIRTWERRYGVVRPSRTPTNRRRYTRQDIEKLRLLRAAVAGGHPIGAVCDLDLEALRRLSSELVASEPAVPHGNAEATVELCLAAVRTMDATTLGRMLDASATDLGPARFIAEVAGPFLQRLGEAWRTDGLHPAQEHMATEMVRARLMRLLEANQGDEGAPTAVVATLRGQSHDAGALLAAVMAACAGWTVRYLGASLPAEEIGWAARSTDARAALISIVYPPDDPRVSVELAELRRAVGTGFPILVGGRSAPAYAAAIADNGLMLCNDLHDLRNALDRIRVEPAR